MTPRENLYRALTGKSPEWIPACVHIANANNLPGFLPKRLLSQANLDRLAISEFVGGDILYETNAVNCVLGGNVKTDGRTEGDIRREAIITPVGVLEQVTQFCRVATPQYDNLPAGYALPWPIVTSTKIEHYVKSVKDYGILRRYFQAQTFEVNQAHIAQEQNRLGDKGLLVLGGGPSSPLYGLIQNFTGIERFSYDLADVPDQIEKTMAVMKEAACRWYARAVQTTCDAIRCTEDLDTKLISPEMFRQYAVPALREYARICHEHGKLFILHMCGHVRDLLSDVRKVGADALHCLSLPPMGNTPLSFARETLAPRASAMIRFDARVLLKGNSEEISNAISGIIDEANDWRGFVALIPCGRASLMAVRHAINEVHRLGRWI